MSGWLVWVAAPLVGWVGVALVLGLVLGRILRLGESQSPDRDGPTLPDGTPSESRSGWAGQPKHRLPRRILVVDDDAGLRLLLRVTLAADEYTVEEAGSAEKALDLIRSSRPGLVVLDVGLPGMSGLELCRRLNATPAFGSPRVILLTGAEISIEEGRAAGAVATLQKPFSPLELVSLIDRLPDDVEPPGRRTELREDEEQLLAYAHDLSRLVQIERAQRRLLEHAYRQTVTSLAEALEAKDQATQLHAMRVRRLALELTTVVEPRLLDDPSLEYGFLLHDIGKIGIPDAILNKPGPLSLRERRLMQQHPLIGAEILQEVALLNGEGLRIVRSHHERWDGRGYPDGLAAERIPAGARIFALADALDAMTHDRPYRRRMSWQATVDVIKAEAGRQFDPDIVDTLAACERRLRAIHEELEVTAPAGGAG